MMVGPTPAALPVPVELKPNRNLLDPNFNGYKLSLETLASYVVSVKTGVDRAQASEKQYSLQHVKRFATHNHIFSDPFNPYVVYVVDKLWTVLRVSIDFTTGRLDVISDVWRIPKPAGPKEGRFNITLAFPDNDHAVISDGSETLFILKTGERKLPEPWKPITTLTPFTGKSSPQFCLLDSIKYASGTDHFIDVLALRIDDKEEWCEVLDKLEDNALSDQSFLTVLEWFTFQEEVEGGDEAKWTLKGQITLLGHSGTDYAYLEPGGTGIYLSSESRFHVVFDKERPINLDASKDNKTKQEKKPEYVWTQTLEEVKLWFKVPSGINKKEVDVEFKRDTVRVSYQGRVVIEGSLSNPAKVEGSYWIIDTPKRLPEDAPDMEGAGDTDADPDSNKYKVLEVILEKEEHGTVWLDEVVKGNAAGQQVSDPEFIQHIHNKLAHLCSDKLGADPGTSDAYDPRQLEECDNYPADSSSFMRIDRAAQKITHTASLGSHQWLFNVRLEASKPPAMCIRHDVDGIVWDPQLLSSSSPPPPDQTTSGDANNPEENKIDWRCEHIATFSALGYVQASKQQRKYTLCSPDISYVAICDVKKHIYVYRQPAKIESSLRNRRTGEHVTHVAKQLVISLDPPQDFLGAYATPSYLYVLTPENFHAIRVLAEEE